MSISNCKRYMLNAVACLLTITFAVVAKFRLLTSSFWHYAPCERLLWLPNLANLVLVFWCCGVLSEVYSGLINVRSFIVVCNFNLLLNSAKLMQLNALQNSCLPFAYGLTLDVDSVYFVIQRRKYCLRCISCGNCRLASYCLLANGS